MTVEGKGATVDSYPATASGEAACVESSDGARRFLDVLIATSGLLFILPLLLIIVVAIYAESGGPIFFCQTRIGLRGNPFLLFKFRKFGASESPNGLAVTLAADPRLTRVGRVLEKTKLDELPQLWNVIRGDMALVGPRPESLRFADCFAGQFVRLMSYKPGIFGPAQVHFRNESDYYFQHEDPEELYRRLLFPAKAAIDLRYYGARTLYQDVLWIGRGVVAVLNVPGISFAGEHRRLGLQAAGQFATQLGSETMPLDGSNEI